MTNKQMLSIVGLILAIGLLAPGVATAQVKLKRPVGPIYLWWTSPYYGSSDSSSSDQSSSPSSSDQSFGDDWTKGGHTCIGGGSDCFCAGCHGVHALETSATQEILLRLAPDRKAQMGGTPKQCLDCHDKRLAEFTTERKGEIIVIVASPKGKVHRQAIAKK